MKYIRLFEQFEEGHKFDILDLFIITPGEVKDLFYEEIEKEEPDIDNLNVFFESGFINFSTELYDGNAIKLMINKRNKTLNDFILSNANLIKGENIKSLFDFEEEDSYYYSEEPLLNHISIIYRLWEYIKDMPELKEMIAQIEDLVYNEDGSFSLNLKNTEELKKLWYEYSDNNFDLVEKVLSENYLADEMYHGDYSYYGGDEIKYLTDKEYDLIRDILNKNKEDIEDFDNLNLQDITELERYIKNSSDDIAKEIKKALIRARVQCEEDEFYSDFRKWVLSESCEWLTGRRYNKDKDFRYEKNDYRLDGIKKDLVIIALSMIWGKEKFTFLDIISNVIQSEEGYDYSGIKADFYRFDNWYPSINSDYFIEEFISNLDLDSELYNIYKSKFK